MFDTTHYLHYVLDAETDFHYTDDLMRLAPDAYLWRELKEVHGFTYVVFVKKNDNGFALEVFDSGSGALVSWSSRKKGFFESKTFSPPEEVQIRHSICQPAQLGRQDSTLLELLCDIQRNARGKKVALVYSPDSLNALLACTDNGLSRLKEFVVDRKKVPNTICVIQIDMTAAALDHTFLQEGMPFPELDPALNKALYGNAHKPLLTALEEQLGERLIDFSTRRNDMLNMLLFDALESSGDQDSSAQLADQAEYLRMSCHYDLSIAYMLGSRGSEPRRRSVIYGKLKETTFRNALRNSAEKLRRTNAEASMQYLFQTEFSPLPEVPSGLRVLYNDSLVKSVSALALPEAYLQFDDTLKSVPAELTKAVRTLWNQRRNPFVCDKIEEYCSAIYSACVEENWDTVTDALLLLRLCARHLCANTAMQCNLDQVFRLGSLVLKDSARLFRAQASFRDLEKIKKSSAAGKVSHMLDSITTSTDKISLQAEQVMLDARRSDLHQCITFFNMQTRTQKEIEDFFRSREASQQESLLQFEEKKKLLAYPQSSQPEAFPTEDAEDDPAGESLPVFDYPDCEEKDEPVEFDHSWRKYTGYRPPWEDDALTDDGQDDPIHFG